MGSTKNEFVENFFHYLGKRECIEYARRCDDLIGVRQKWHRPMIERIETKCSTTCCMGNVTFSVLERVKNAEASGCRAE